METVMSIQNQVNVSKIWVDLCDGKKVMLWCGGLNVDSVIREIGQQVWMDMKEMKEFFNTIQKKVIMSA